MEKRLAMVEWYDASHNVSTTLHDVLNGSYFVRTTGILEEENKKNHLGIKVHVVVTHDGGSDHDSDRFDILSSSIKKITYLKPVEEKK